MPEFTVRQSQAGDLAALDAMFARSYAKLLKADYPPSVLVTALPLISKAQPMLIRSGTYFVAQLQDGEIIGAGGWTPRLRKAEGDIRHLVTDLHHQRRGVARAILTKALESATDAGVRHLMCNSTRTAKPFYRAFGFETLGEIEMELRPGIHFPAIRMRKDL